MQSTLPGLLHEAHRDHLTGAIQLRSSNGLSQIWLRGGYPAEVLLPDGQERLGQVLLEIGVLDRNRYLHAQTVQPLGTQRIGAVLLQARLLDKAGLLEGLRSQVRRRLQRLFALHEGAYQVFSGPHNHGANGAETGEVLRCDPVRAIYFGVRRWPEHLLVAGLSVLSGQEFHLPAAWVGDLARWLQPAETRVCELLGRGAWTVPELAEVAGLHQRDLLALLYTLATCEALEVRPPNPDRPRRPLHRPPQVADLPVRPTDEPLPTSPVPQRTEERPVVLHAGAEPPPRVAGRRDRPVEVVPIAADPTSGEPPEPPPVAETSPVRRDPTGPLSGRRPPPLRTSLPQSRLKR